ncbi:acyltransferase [Ornithinimicrobium sp. LYQ103]|uniref:acyltransferase n=1 Tax=Ornithinimicrobium sp. LYQ103 TaxID=3378796 RepID=UPI003855354A
MSISLMQVRGILRQLFRTVHSKVSPLGYASSLGVKLGEDVHFYGMRPGMFSTEPWLIRIGSHVHITSGCQFVTHDGGTLALRHLTPDLEVTAPIIVGNRVYIGMNSMILPGVTIGDDVVIGAGSMVTKDIPAGSVAAGVPARVIKSIDQYHGELRAKSLHFGHMSALEKEKALKQHFRSFIEGAK